MPHIAWSEDGFFGFPVAIMLLVGKCRTMLHANPVLLDSASQQVPYIAWSEDGFFGFPVALLLLGGKYVSELFGRKAGVELPQSWPFKRLGYHHSGARPGDQVQWCCTASVRQLVKCGCTTEHVLSESGAVRHYLRHFWCLCGGYHVAGFVPHAAAARKQVMLPVAWQALSNDRTTLCTQGHGRAP